MTRTYTMSGSEFPSTNASPAIVAPSAAPSAVLRNTPVMRDRIEPPAMTALFRSSPT